MNDWPYEKPVDDFVLDIENQQAQGLIGWWPGIEQSGLRLKDLSGFGNNGTINGTIPAGGVWRAGIDAGNNANLFDGTTSYVGIGTGLNPSAITLQAWVRLDSLAGSASRSILVKRNAGSSCSWALDWSPSGGANFRFYHLNSSFRVWSTGANATLVAGVWTLVQVTYDGVNAPKLYVNGKLVSWGATATPAALVSTAVEARIGWFTNATLATDAPWIGAIEGARVYSRIRSAAECYGDYVPATRWFLHSQPGRKSFGFFAGLAGRVANCGLTLDNILAASVAAAAIVGSASNGLANASLSGQAAGAVAASGSGTVSESITSSAAVAVAGSGSGTVTQSVSSSAAVAVASAAAIVLQAESVNGTAANKVAAALTTQLGDVALNATVTVATNASLSKAIDAIVLNSMGTVASVGTGRIAVLIETLNDVQLVAIAGNVVFGPFRVVDSQITLPGAKQIQITTGGADTVQITLPGAVRSQIIAENEV